MKANAESLFEVSWEVCNKVGGIYTVIKSKATYISEYYGENYVLIGPYIPERIIGEFSEQLAPDNYKKAFEEMKKEGVECHFGKWMIPSMPNVILLDFGGFMGNVNRIKRELWDFFGVDSLRAGYDYDEPVVWAYAVGKLIEKIEDNKKIVVQFHEWLAGAGLLYLKSRNANIATVFTTHATILGRTLASDNVDLYCVKPGGMCELEEIDKPKTAYKYGMEPKHLLEHACVENADIFTTVSEITSIEAEYIHGRKADVLLLNGLDLAKFPTFEEGSIAHRKNREKIHEFLMSYFFPYYSFEVEESLIFFLSGRYEFRDKGVDIYIAALSKLNDMLKKENSKKTIIAFIWIPSAIKSIKPVVLENKTFFKDIKETVDDSIDDIRQKILNTLASGKKLSVSVFSDDFLLETRRKSSALKKKGGPPLATHDLIDENDIIMRHLLQAGLDNMEDDRVKIIFYPVYISGTDGLLELDYYNAISGCHLGVFPSYYEPWGYTPLETGALGVSSVTTDLSGFGRYIQGKVESKKYPGVFVLQRFNKKDDEIIDDLAGFMHEFANYTKQERVQNKIEAKRLAGLADWSNFITFYIEAHNKAVAKRY